MEKVHIVLMNKKCIYYETCYESHTECLCGKECEDYEPITERRGNKACVIQNSIHGDIS
jgi:hypothetical protein